MSKQQQTDELRALAAENPSENHALPTAIPVEKPVVPRYFGAWQLDVGICITLTILIAGVYGQTSDFQFINYDDDDYVYANPHVRAGLTYEGLGWAFTHRHAANWHPLSYISHMLDVHLFGVDPGAHHLTNLAIHTLGSISLYFALRALTRVRGRSAFVAAVFAVHPLHVESVAWIAERKDVLSGLFFSLTLLAYAAFARRPGGLFYFAALFLFAAGLMAKPMLVTLPFVLLLLDYWPLHRMTLDDLTAAGSSNRLRLILEKLPFFALSGLSCAVTIWAQQSAIQSVNDVALWPRIANALVAYVIYMRQTLLPFDLAPIYPLTTAGAATWQIVGSFAILMLASFFVADHCRRRPYLLVGWLWFLGMLVPVIGIVQVRSQAHADRYMYLPQIGLVVAATWWFVERAREAAISNWLIRSAAAACLAALAYTAYRQTYWWHDSRRLFEHALDCTKENTYAHTIVGLTLQEAGDDAAAAEHFQKALAIWPRNRWALRNYGLLLLNSGEWKAAKSRLSQAAELDPQNASVWSGLGRTHFRLAEWEEAEQALRRARDLNPTSAEAHNDYGVILATRGGKLSEAIAEFRAAHAADSGHAESTINLARSLIESGDATEGINLLTNYLQDNPDNVNTLRFAAWIAATNVDERLRNGQKAINWARHAVDLTGGQDCLSLEVLAAAYAENRQFLEAMKAAQHAYELTARPENKYLQQSFLRNLNLINNRQPIRASAVEFGN